MNKKTPAPTEAYWQKKMKTDRQTDTHTHTHTHRMAQILFFLFLLMIMRIGTKIYERLLCARHSAQHLIPLTASYEAEATMSPFFR